VFETSQLLLFMLSALGLLLIPGPSVLYIIARGVSQGRTAALASVVGIQLGGLCHVLAAALGVSALLLSSALLFQAVKLAGALYLIYIGVRTILSHNNKSLIEMKNESIVRVFWQGFIVNLLNPKTALFFLAFLPQFVHPERGSAIIQVMALGLLFIGMAVITDGSYALLSGSIKPWLERYPMVQQQQNKAIGAVYIGLGTATALIQAK
jgi:threonine/homoserine/homoserine lactone efflux protein